MNRFKMRVLPAVEHTGCVQVKHLHAVHMAHLIRLPIGQGLSDRDMAAIGGMVAIKLRDPVADTCHPVHDLNRERPLGLIDV